MTADEKLAAILAAVQIDPGNRGLARDPVDNLFTATAGDFAAACRSIALHPKPILAITTGFFIPTAEPPTFETDGPLGTVFLLNSLSSEEIQTWAMIDDKLQAAHTCGLFASGWKEVDCWHLDFWKHILLGAGQTDGKRTHLISIEHAGIASDGRRYSMRGHEIQNHPIPADIFFNNSSRGDTITIGIGDGGNEIGMGKIPHETIVKNIPNGDLIHCRVPTDHLIVAGVSNWGAYALAAGIYVLRGVKPPPDLFDPDREQEILEVMVREGPLVDGVTGKHEATVDGLSWEEYVKPLIRIREILES